MGKDAREITIVSDSENRTIGIGKALGRIISSPCVIALVGTLGSGKTTFTKGVALGLGVKDSREIKSPSFTVMNEYRGRHPVYHFDLFRLDKLSDLEEIGFEEFLYSNSVSIIEWARNVEDYLPREYLEIEFDFIDENRRKLNFKPQGAKYKGLVGKLSAVKA